MDMNRKQFIGSLFAGITIGCNPAFATEQSEFDKCKADILYWVDNYLSVHDRLYGDLKMSPQQREYLKRVSTTPDYFFCAKGRQIGISTANNVFAYWKTTFFGPDYHVFIVEPNERMKERIKELYGNISDTGSFIHSPDNVHFIVPDRLRGIDWHDKNNTFILDEFAFWSDGDMLKEVSGNLMNAWFKNEIKSELYEKYACNFIVASTPDSPSDFFSTLMSINDDSRRLILPSPMRGLKA